MSAVNLYAHTGSGQSQLRLIRPFRECIIEEEVACHNLHLHIDHCHCYLTVYQPIFSNFSIESRVTLLRMFVKE